MGTVCAPSGAAARTSTATSRPSWNHRGSTGFLAAFGRPPRFLFACVEDFAHKGPSVESVSARGFNASCSRNEWDRRPTGPLGLFIRQCHAVKPEWRQRRTIQDFGTVDPRSLQIRFLSSQLPVRGFRSCGARFSRLRARRWVRLGPLAVSAHDLVVGTPVAFVSPDGCRGARRAHRRGQPPVIPSVLLRGIRPRSQL